MTKREIELAKVMFVFLGDWYSAHWVERVNRRGPVERTSRSLSVFRWNASTRWTSVIGLMSWDDPDHHAVGGMIDPTTTSNFAKQELRRCAEEAIRASYAA